MLKYVKVNAEWSKRYWTRGIYGSRDLRSNFQIADCRDQRSNLKVATFCPFGKALFINFFCAVAM